MQIGTWGLILVIILAIIIVWAWSSCSLKCTYEESFTPKRGASDYILGDNAYGRLQLPDYSENVRYPIKEGFHPYHDCVAKCSNVTGSGLHAKCIQSCVAGQISPGNRGVPCTSDDDCGGNDICVLGGPYTGSSHKGECMNPREPFRFSCYPGYFLNELTGECEPRWQGKSSASYHPPPVRGPMITIPGSTTPQYGVGLTDPFDQKTNTTIY